MIHAVVPFRGRERIREAIKKAKLVFYEYDGDESHVFFVHDSTTTQDIAEQLGLRAAGGPSSIVLPVSNYTGFADPNLWEWLSNHEDRF